MQDLTDRSKYILLAEDNSADIDLVREALDDRGILCELHVVLDGEQAVEFIEQIDRDQKLACPELFLLDLHLPKRDGEEILERVRSSDRCSHTPVLVMTSLARGKELDKALRYSAVEYFRKPNTLEQFLALGDVVIEMIGRCEPSPASIEP